MSDAPVQPGEILAGKYRVEQVLGVGGMGVVVAATHIQLDERVAIKFLVADALENAEAVARFAREARAAVKIKSEHVARVIDVGTLETGAPYMVMEYLDGSDLARVVGNQGRLPIEDAVEYVLQACEAIAQAHVLGIVHRDLKPANLFLTHRADGSQTVKVLDFGISKVIPVAGSSSSDASMTRTRAVMGSPLYMSPEQMASSRDVDGRTDIWALGAILYELIAGQPPFIADSLPQLCTLILNGPPAPIRAICPQVPPGLEAVILRCLEKTPARRYANISEFATALADFGPRRARLSVERVSRVIHSANLSASGAVIGRTLPNATGSQTGGSWSDTKTTPPKGSRKTLFIGLGLLVGIGAIVALFVVRRGGTGAPAVAGAAGAAPTTTPTLVDPPSKIAAVPSSTLTPVPATIPPPGPVPEKPPPLAPPAVSEALRGPGRKPPVAHPPVAAHQVPSAPAAPAKPPAAVDLFDDRK